MKRELGIARCGLACCLCSENDHCGGCNSGDCPGTDFCENRPCSMEKGIDYRNENYVLLSNGKPVKPSQISQGERNIIGLLYQIRYQNRVLCRSRENSESRWSL